MEESRDISLVTFDRNLAEAVVNVSVLFIAVIQAVFGFFSREPIH